MAGTPQGSGHFYISEKTLTPAHFHAIVKKDTALRINIFREVTMSFISSITGWFARRKDQIVRLCGSLASSLRTFGTKAGGYLRTLTNWSVDRGHRALSSTVARGKAYSKALDKFLDKEQVKRGMKTLIVFLALAIVAKPLSQMEVPASLLFWTFVALAVILILLILAIVAIIRPKWKLFSAKYLLIGLASAAIASIAYYAYRHIDALYNSVGNVDLSSVPQDLWTVLGVGIATAFFVLLWRKKLRLSVVVFAAILGFIVYLVYTGEPYVSEESMVDSMPALPRPHDQKCNHWGNRCLFTISDPRDPVVLPVPIDVTLCPRLPRGMILQEWTGTGWTAPELGISPGEGVEFKPPLPSTTKIMVTAPDAEANAPQQFEIASLRRKVRCGMVWDRDSIWWFRESLRGPF